MSRPKVLLQFALRCLGWNLLAAGLLGGGYGLVLGILLLVLEADIDWSLPMIGTAIVGIITITSIAGIIGVIIGLFMGFIVGVANGLLLGLLTLGFAFPEARMPNYRLLLRYVGMVINISVTLALGSRLEGASDPWLPDSTPMEHWLIAVGIPTLVACGVAWWVADHLASWYQRRWTSVSNC